MNADIIPFPNLSGPPCRASESVTVVSMNSSLGFDAIVTPLSDLSALTPSDVERAAAIVLPVAATSNSESAGRPAVATASSSADARLTAKLAAASPDVSVFSDLEPVISALERAWLLQPGAGELPRTLPFSKNTSVFRVAAASEIQFASSSSTIPTT